MNNRELVYVGVKGSVVAYDQSTGEQVWSTALKGSQFVNIILERGRIFAHTTGELFALNAETGALLWKDELKGYGYDLATLASRSAPSGNPAVLAEHFAEEQRRSSASAAAGAGST